MDESPKAGQPTGSDREFVDFPESYKLAGHNRDDTTFVIDWFLVPFGSRRSGEGRDFYKAVERWVRSDGEICKICLLAVDAGNGHSKGFWEKMGFEYVEDARDRDDDDEQYWMEKSF